MNNKKTSILAGSIVLISVVLDQITKFIVQNHLQGKGFVGVIGDAIGFEYVRNPGAFLGMFSDARWAFMIPSLLIIGVMSVWLYVKRNPSPLFITSMALLIGGGIGNMFDRILLGYVIDFISFRFINFPNFNVADSCVTIGCVLFAVCALFTKEDIFDVTLFPKKNPAPIDNSTPEGTEEVPEPSDEP